MVNKTFYLSEQLMVKLNLYCEETHLKKSTVVGLALEEYLKSREVNKIDEEGETTRDK